MISSDRNEEGNTKTETEVEDKKEAPVYLNYIFSEAG
jgi:hypothetical protein